uniref:Uncharacterized protein n=1 Tax=Opuntia streptacantha TaxID=393608 RepID=A0A7C9AWK5_OPUST
MLFFVKLKMGFLQNVHIYSKKKKYKAQNSKIYFLQFLSVFDKFVNCNIRFQRIKNSKTQIFFFCFAVKMHRLAHSWTKTLRLVSLEDKKKPRVTEPKTNLPHKHPRVSCIGRTP